MQKTFQSLCVTNYLSLARRVGMFPEVRCYILPWALLNIWRRTALSDLLFKSQTSLILRDLAKFNVRHVEISL